MDKRLIWTTEELNCYGFWVLTAGAEMGRFEKNPIMLFNHHRTVEGKRDEILPVGKWRDWRVEADGSITGVPVFDMTDEFAAAIARKVEGEFLSACSVGIRILEVSEEPRYLKQGQTRPTVIKWELRETSVVDIPANPGAAGIVLYDADDNVITLSDDGSEGPLRLINQSNNVQMKQVALKLGLSDGATEAEVLSAVTSLTDKHAGEVAALKADKAAAEAELKLLKDEQAAAQKAEAAELVEGAVKEGKITAELKDTYLKLFETDFDNTKRILGGTPARRSLSDRAATAGSGTEYASMSWDDLDRKGLLAELKEKHPDLYEVKYKSMSAGLNIKKS